MFAIIIIHNSKVLKRVKSQIIKSKIRLFIILIIIFIFTNLNIVYNSNNNKPLNEDQSESINILEDIHSSDFAGNGYFNVSYKQEYTNSSDRLFNGNESINIENRNNKLPNLNISGYIKNLTLIGENKSVNESIIGYYNETYRIFAYTSFRSPAYNSNVSLVSLYLKSDPVYNGCISIYIYNSINNGTEIIPNASIGGVENVYVNHTGWLSVNLDNINLEVDNIYYICLVDKRNEDNMDTSWAYSDDSLTGDNSTSYYSSDQNTFIKIKNGTNTVDLLYNVEFTPDPLSNPSISDLQMNVNGTAIDDSGNFTITNIKTNGADITLNFSCNLTGYANNVSFILDEYRLNYSVSEIKSGNFLATGDNIINWTLNIYSDKFSNENGFDSGEIFILGFNGNITSASRGGTPVSFSNTEGHSTIYAGNTAGLIIVYLISNNTLDSLVLFENGHRVNYFTNKYSSPSHIISINVSELYGALSVKVNGQTEYSNDSITTGVINVSIWGLEIGRNNVSITYYNQSCAMVGYINTSIYYLRWGEITMDELETLINGEYNMTYHLEVQGDLGAYNISLKDMDSNFTLFRSINYSNYYMERLLLDIDPKNFSLGSTHHILVVINASNFVNCTGWLNFSIISTPIVHRVSGGADYYIEVDGLEYFENASVIINGTQMIYQDPHGFLKIKGKIIWLSEGSIRPGDTLYISGEFSTGEAFYVRYDYRTFDLSYDLYNNLRYSVDRENIDFNIILPLDKQCKGHVVTYYDIRISTVLSGETDAGQPHDYVFRMTSDTYKMPKYVLYILDFKPVIKLFLIGVIIFLYTVAVFALYKNESRNARFRVQDAIDYIAERMRQYAEFEKRAGVKPVTPKEELKKAPEGKTPTLFIYSTQVRGYDKLLDKMKDRQILKACRKWAKKLKEDEAAGKPPDWTHIYAYAVALRAKDIIKKIEDDLLLKKQRKEAKLKKRIQKLTKGELLELVGDRKVIYHVPEYYRASQLVRRYRLATFMYFVLLFGSAMGFINYFFAWPMIPGIPFYYVFLLILPIAGTFYLLAAKWVELLIKPRAISIDDLAEAYGLTHIGSFATQLKKVEERANSPEYMAERYRVHKGVKYTFFMLNLLFGIVVVHIQRELFLKNLRAILYYDLWDMDTEGLFLVFSILFYFIVLFYSLSDKEYPWLASLSAALLGAFSLGKEYIVLWGIFILINMVYMIISIKIVVGQNSKKHTYRKLINKQGEKDIGLPQTLSSPDIINRAVADRNISLYMAERLHSGRHYLYIVYIIEVFWAFLKVYNNNGQKIFLNAGYMILLVFVELLLIQLVFEHIVFEPLSYEKWKGKRKLVISVEIILYIIYLSFMILLKMQEGVLVILWSYQILVLIKYLLFEYGTSTYLEKKKYYIYNDGRCIFCVSEEEMEEAKKDDEYDAFSEPEFDIHAYMVSVMRVEPEWVEEKRHLLEFMFNAEDYIMENAPTRVKDLLKEKKGLTRVFRFLSRTLLFYIYKLLQFMRTHMVYELVVFIFGLYTLFRRDLSGLTGVESAAIILRALMFSIMILLIGLKLRDRDMFKRLGIDMIMLWIAFNYYHEFLYYGLIGILQISIFIIIAIILLVFPELKMAKMIGEIIKDLVETSTDDDPSYIRVSKVILYLFGDVWIYLLSGFATVFPFSLLYLAEYGEMMAVTPMVIVSVILVVTFLLNDKDFKDGGVAYILLAAGILLIIANRYLTGLGHIVEFSQYISKTLIYPGGILIFSGVIFIVLGLIELNVLVYSKGGLRGYLSYVKDEIIKVFHRVNDIDTKRKNKKSMDLRKIRRRRQRRSEAVYMSVYEYNPRSEAYKPYILIGRVEKKGEPDWLTWACLETFKFNRIITQMNINNKISAILKTGLNSLPGVYRKVYKNKDLIRGLVYKCIGDDAEYCYTPKGKINEYNLSKYLLQRLIDGEFAKPLLTEEDELVNDDGDDAIYYLDVRSYGVWDTLTRASKQLLEHMKKHGEMTKNELVRTGKDILRRTGEQARDLAQKGLEQTAATIGDKLKEMIDNLINKNVVKYDPNKKVYYVNVNTYGVWDTLTRASKQLLERLKEHGQMTKNEILKTGKDILRRTGEQAKELAQKGLEQTAATIGDKLKEMIDNLINKNVIVPKK